MGEKRGDFGSEESKTPGLVGRRGAWDDVEVVEAFEEWKSGIGASKRTPAQRPGGNVKWMMGSHEVDGS